MWRYFSVFSIFIVVCLRMWETSGQLDSRISLEVNECVLLEGRVSLAVRYYCSVDMLDAKTSLHRSAQMLAC